jgi:hypothetical protein
VVYPNSEDDDYDDCERPITGWDRQHWWVVRGVPIMPRHGRWMRRLLTRTIIPIFEAVDFWTWRSRAPSPEDSPASFKATGPKRIFRAEERQQRERRLPHSAISVLEALVERQDRTNARPQRHDLLRETGLKEPTLDWALREILIPEELVQKRECFYELTPLGGQRVRALR